MDSNDHVVYLTPKEAVELFSAVNQRARIVKGSEGKTYLLSAAARIDTALGKGLPKVPLCGRIGWLRIMGQLAGAKIAAEIERQLHQEVSAS